MAEKEKERAKDELFHNALKMVAMKEFGGNITEQDIDQVLYQLGDHNPEENFCSQLGLDICSY